MSYNKMMKWNKQRPKGTSQPVLMSTGSGFWPSGAFIKKWVEYADEMTRQGKPYLSTEEYYKTKLQ